MSDDHLHCHVTRFTVYGNADTSLDFSAGEDLGVMTWEALAGKVTAEGGRRVTYDLFDVPQPDGTTLRFRAVDV